MKNVRQQVECTQCGNSIIRVVWNYGKNRAITEFFCDNICKGAWQRGQREANGWTEEWLYQKYIVERLDCTQISKIVKRDSKQVWRWITDYGIVTRKRGTYEERFFKKGHKNCVGRKLSEAHKQLLRETRLRDGHVPYLKNGVHHLKGKRGADTPNWKGGVTPDRPAFYSSLEWKAACVAVWKRDNGVCKRCGEKQSNETRGKFHIHHIVSFQCKELRADPNNLIFLCRLCHLWVHSKKNTMKQFIQAVPNLRNAEQLADSQRSLFDTEELVPVEENDSDIDSQPPLA